jgi:hypothetical protein
MVGLLLYLWYYGCSTVGPLLLKVVGEEAKRAHCCGAAVGGELAKSL